MAEIGMGNGRFDPTRVVKLDGWETAADGATRVASEEGSVTRVASDTGQGLMLEPEVVSFTDGSGNIYRIDLGSVVGAGGQAVVVDATDWSGRPVVAKISEPLTWSARRSYEDVISVVMELSRRPLSSTHLMPVLAYARGGVEARLLGEAQRRRFDIAILPKGECLGERVLEPGFVRERVIPELACAIHTLQGRGIVHSDVKPLNVFLVDGQVVLGDYGAARSLEGMDYRNTMTSRVSMGYTASDRIIAPANDWYSFGYTVWTMYDANVHPLHTFFSIPGGLDIVHRGISSVDFVPREAGDETLGNLLKGLTLEDAASRFGYDEVMEWVADPSGFAKVPQNAATSVRPYEMNGVHYTDPRRLAQALSEDWSDARRRLLRLESWLGDAGYNDLETEVHALTLEDDVISGNPDLCLACVIYVMSDGALWSWYGRDVSIGTLAASLASPADGGFTETEESLLPLLRSGFLGWAVRRSAQGDAGALEMAASLDEIRDLAERNSRLAFLMLQGCLADVPDARAYVQDAVSALLARPALFAATVSGAPSCETWLSRLACHISPRSLAKARDAIVDKKGSIDIDQFLLFLEGISDDKVAVRDFYLAYGPGAPWLWAARHADQYEVLRDDGEARQQKEDSARRSSRRSSKRRANKEQEEPLPSALTRLSELPSSSEQTLKELVRTSSTAHAICVRLRAGMCRTPVPYLHGWQTGASVAPRTSDALFCSSARGELVPRGYVREVIAYSSQVTGDAQDLLKAFRIEQLADSASTDSREYRTFLSDEKNANTASLEATLETLRTDYNLESGSKGWLLFVSAAIVVVYALVASYMADGFARAVAALGLPIMVVIAVLIVCILRFLVGNYRRHARMNTSVAALQRRLDGNDYRLGVLFDVLAAFDRRTGEDAEHLSSVAFACMLPRFKPLPFSDDSSGVSGVDQASERLARLAIWGWRSAFALMSIGSIFYFFSDRILNPDIWTWISLAVTVLVLLYVALVLLKPDGNPFSINALFSWLWLPVAAPMLICWLIASVILSLLSSLPAIIVVIIIFVIVCSLFA